MVRAATFAFFGELLARLSPPGRTLLRTVRTLDICIGGAEANVAIGLSNLGHPTRMISRIPDNALGAMARSALLSEGVDCTHVIEAPGRLGLYFLTPGASLRSSEVVYDRAGSVFAASHAEDYVWDAALEGATHLHLSGITPALGERSARAALTAARAAKTKGLTVIFDGNYRARLWEAWDSNPRAILTELTSLTDILFGSHRDISLMLGRELHGDGPERRREAAEAAFDAFPDLKIISSTARHVVDADSHRIAARIDTRDTAAQTPELLVSGIVDRIGAGDAFAAGVLHGLIHYQGDIEAAARSGLALTALKHSLPGDASLFGQSDVDAFLSGELDVRR